MDQLSIITQMFENLSDHEKSEFLKYLKADKTNQEIKSSDTQNEIVLKHSKNPLPDRPDCPHCQSHYVVKYGRNGNVQKFKCKDCGKIFNVSTNTILFSTKKDLETWKLFCECMINKSSLRKCAQICNINLHTAFNWRHKILDALQNMQSDVTLNGIVESDETFFAVSFKGSKKENFSIPRVAHNRGHSVPTRGLSCEMVCVPSSVDLDHHSIGLATNLGKPCIQDVSKVLDQRVQEGSILVTDSYKGYQKVAFENGLTHVRIPRGKHKSGSFNINTVNSYHSELKRLVDHYFKGVATKYLNNYIVYNNFVNFARDTYSNKLSILQYFVFSTTCMTRGYAIKNRPTLPF